MTATTPTAIAVRFTIDKPNAVFTNRLVHSSILNNQPSSAKVVDFKLERVPNNRLSGRAKIHLNMKLGQLYKSALYEEIQDELEEYANFMTQVNFNINIF